MIIPNYSAHIFHFAFEDHVESSVKLRTHSGTSSSTEPPRTHHDPDACAMSARSADRQLRCLGQFGQWGDDGRTSPRHCCFQALVLPTKKGPNGGSPHVGRWCHVSILHLLKPKIAGHGHVLASFPTQPGLEGKKLYRRLRKKYGDYRADGVEAAALGVASHFWREQNSIPIYSLLS